MKQWRGVIGEPDDGKLSRPVRWGAYRKGVVCKSDENLARRLPNYQRLNVAPQVKTKK